MVDELEPEQTEDEDDIAGLFDWAVNIFNSGGTDLKDYTATLKQGTVTTVSDGNTTITLEVSHD
jgi:hypothetical protein